VADLPDPAIDKLSEVLSRLENVRKVAGQYLASCPAHEDSSPSLAVRAGDTGIVVYCHAGCTTKAVLAAIDLTWNDLFWDRKTSREAKKRPWNAERRRSVAIEATMAAEKLQSETGVLERLHEKRGWTSEALALLGVGWDETEKRLTLPSFDKEGELNDVLRYDPFAGGRWKMLQSPGRPRLPWPPPETVSTEYRARFLFVVEGEGTALSLWSLGLPAVALPGSVSGSSGSTATPGRFRGNGWHPSWARRFVQKRLVLIPDADLAGRTLMTTVGFDLEKEIGGVSITLLDLLPHSTAGLDVGDWARPFKSSDERRRARDLLVAAVDAQRRGADEAEESRRLLVGYHKFVRTGELPREDAVTGGSPVGRGGVSVPATPSPIRESGDAVPSGEKWSWD